MQSGSFCFVCIWLLSGCSGRDHRACKAEKIYCLYRKSLLISSSELKTRYIPIAQITRIPMRKTRQEGGTLKQRGGALHLDNPADEDIIALMVDSVSHQNFIHHWNENLVL